MTRPGGRVGVVTQARTTSTRLPGKVMLEVGGRTLLDRHCDRLESAGLTTYVATTTNAADDPIVELAQRRGLAFFRGSEADVLSRFAGLVREQGLDTVVRVTSDCPLIDGSVVAAAVEEFVAAEDPWLYLSNGIVRTFPRGMDFEVFSAEALLDADEHAVDPAHREHVTPYLYTDGSGRITRRDVTRTPSAAAYRLTLGHPRRSRAAEDADRGPRRSRARRRRPGGPARLPAGPGGDQRPCRAEEARPVSPERLLVIHSGTFKTGSTAIQLYLNRADHHGVLSSVGATYSRVGRIHSIQHANLTAELMGGRVFVPGHGGWEALITQITTGTHPVTVISSETFSLLDAAALRRVGDLCRRAGVGIRWIHYVREQAGLYNAFYVERIVTLRPDLEMIALPFEACRSHARFDLEFLRYASFMERLYDAIPDVDLRVRPFARELLAENDVVADFCATAELPHDPVHGGHTNVGTGWKTVETARRLIPAIKEAGLRGQLTGIPNRPAARQRWLQLIRSELVHATTAEGWNSESAVYLTPDFRAELHQEYRDENTRLDAQVDFPWLETVDATPLKAFNIGDYDDIPAEELVRVVTRVLRTVYRMPDEIAALRPQTPEAKPNGSSSIPRRVLAATRRRLRRRA